jgi:hypothetical protein
MYKTITYSDFHRAFRDSDRENQFSPEAKLALYEYLTRREKETGKQIELNIHALCRTYVELSGNKDWRKLAKNFVNPHMRIIWYAKTGYDTNSYLFEKFCRKSGRSGQQSQQTK